MKPMDLASDIDPALFEPIFLVGCIRSGTTLLSQILDCHPEICYCPFELKHIWSKSGRAPMASPKTRDLDCPFLTHADASSDVRSALLTEFNKVFVAKKKFKSADAYFLNKNPHLSNKLEFVSSLFPKAKFIWIVREMFPMVASTVELFKAVNKSTNTWHIWPIKDRFIRGRCWNASFDSQKPAFVNFNRIFPGGNVQFIAEYWLETNQLIKNFAKTNPKHTFAFIRYEDVISAPKDNLRKLLTTLGIPFSSQINCVNIDESRNQLWATRLSNDEMNALQIYKSTFSSEIEDVLSPLTDNHVS